MNISSIISLFLMVAIVLHIGVGIYAYKVMRLANYLRIWRNGWIYFIISIVATTLRRGIELNNTPDSDIHTALAFISSVALIMFIYNISKVFKSITRIHTESRFISLLRNLPSGVIVYKSDTSVIYSNPMASLIFGVSNEDMKGLFSKDKEWHLTKEDGTDLPIEEFPINRILRTGEPFNNMVVGINHRKDIKWVICNAYMIDEDNTVVVVFTDITELRQTESLLFQSEEKYQKAFEASHDAIVISRMVDGSINSVNSGFCVLSGYTKEEIKGKSTFILWKKMSDREELIRRLKLEGSVSNFETSFIKKNGQCIRTLLTSCIITLDGLPYILSSVREINERSGIDRRIVNGK